MALLDLERFDFEENRQEEFSLQVGEGVDIKLCVGNGGTTQQNLQPKKRQIDTPLSQIFTKFGTKSN
jgi:hypothetical protein